MQTRLQLSPIKDRDAVTAIVRAEYQTLCGRYPQTDFDKLVPLITCCDKMVAGGALTLIVQRRVKDPDFLAEFNAYYSRQYATVVSHCTRLHFFSRATAAGTEALQFLDVPETKDSYLGFITLRPVIRTPVGASILDRRLVTGFLKSVDKFPVHIGGVEFEVKGAPFMQQDNAVGACAQASIWMALRTMRRREGDRAHDPAQITDAATRYVVAGRKLPNRDGLHSFQMTEAIRAAGYSPHVVNFIPRIDNKPMDDKAIDDRVAKLHPYVESELPVIAILEPPGQTAHAVVIVGHGWQAAPATFINREFTVADGGAALDIALAASWIPDFIINNDNTGPYLPLPRKSQGAGYAIEHISAAIPLLPSDVFMTGEEALELGCAVIGDTLRTLAQVANRAEIEAIAKRLVIRAVLVEKWRLRRWAAKSALPPMLQNTLRSGYLPRRVWLLELHDRANYGDHAAGPIKSLLGLTLLDPTGDFQPASVLLNFMNYSELLPPKAASVLVVREEGAGLKSFQVEKCGPLPPFSD